MWWLLYDPNFQWVIAGSTLLGITSGVVGTFALLRGRSLLGDVLAHSALPGVCIAFMLTQSKEVAPLLLGASLAAVASVWCVDAITRWSRTKEETALAVVLTVFFGLGVVLLTAIQHSGAGNQAGLDDFLFGQAAAMVGTDVYVVALVSLLVLAAVALFFKEFKALCFDPAFAAGAGLNVRLLDGILMALTVLAVVTGLQAVGVVLMAALLVTPAIAARYWTDRLSVMAALAGLFGGISGAAGTLLSTAAPRLPTGPLTVLSATALFLASLAFAPRKGLVARALRQLRLHRRIARENLLRAIYERYETALSAPAVADDGLLNQGIDLARLISDSGGGLRMLRLARTLQREGLLALNEGGGRLVCSLTARGLEAAWEVVHRHRLWEMFLMHEANLGADHVDRDADDIEHFLGPEATRELEKLLRLHNREPRLLPSVHPLHGPGERPAGDR